MTNFEQANRYEEPIPEQLARVAQARRNLIARGAPADGRAMTIESESKNIPGLHRQETVWLLGNRVLGELHVTGSGEDGKGWLRRLVDVNIETGELNVFGVSDHGAGGKTSNVLTGEDLYATVDGPQMGQLRTSMEDIRWNLFAGKEVKIEQRDLGEAST